MINKKINGKINIKFIVSLILILVLSAFLISCQSKKEDDLKSIIESKTTAYKTDLDDSLNSLKTNKDIRGFLTNWAKNKNIDYKVDKAGNVIMKKLTSELYKRAKPTVVIASYDEKNIKNDINQMTSALYLIKNTEKVGELTVIFTPSKGHNFAGIKKLNKKYITDNSNVFCLTDGQSQMWSFNTGGQISYKFQGNLDYTEPSGTTAYKISIKGLPGGIPDSRIGSYPNPIKKFVDLLAYFKTRAKIFELADIKGGNSSTLYPTKASMTLVVGDNYKDKIKEKLNDIVENFNDDYKEKYPDAFAECKEVPLPKKVLTKDSLNEFVSSEYSLISGVYSKNSEDNVNAITNIGTIELGDEYFVNYASAYSLSSKSMLDITNDYKILCGLSNLKFEKYNKVPIWDDKEAKNSKFAEEINKAFKDYTTYDMEYKSTVESTNASYVNKINPKANIVDISYGPEKIERYAGTIYTFMLNQPHEEERTNILGNEEE